MKNFLFITLPIIIALVFGYATEAKNGFISYGIYSATMFLSIYLNGIISAVKGIDTNQKSFSFWTLYFIFSIQLCLTFIFL